MAPSRMRAGPDGGGGSAAGAAGSGAASGAASDAAAAGGDVGNVGGGLASGADAVRIAAASTDIQRLIRGARGRRKSSAAAQLAAVAAQLAQSAAPPQPEQPAAAPDPASLSAATDIQRLIRGARGRRKSAELSMQVLGKGALLAGAMSSSSDGSSANAAESAAQRMEAARAKVAAAKMARGVPQTQAKMAPSKARAEDKSGDDEVHEWTAAQWLQSLGLHHAIKSALDLPAGNQFHYCRRLTRANLTHALYNSNIVADMIDLVMKGVEKLQGANGGVQDVRAVALSHHGHATIARAVRIVCAVRIRSHRARRLSGRVWLRALLAQGTVSSDKFQTNAKFQMSYGSLSLFYGGLESLIGPPKMINGSLLQSMAREHQGEADSKIPFSTPNGMRTQSTTEWEVRGARVATLARLWTFAQARRGGATCVRAC
jgi:hypothetical protein